MLGLIVYAAIVAAGLIVVTLLLAHLILQAIRDAKQQEERDSGLNDLASDTVG